MNERIMNKLMLRQQKDLHPFFKKLEKYTKIKTSKMNK